MDNPSNPIWLQIAEAAASAATALGVLAGGIWAYYRFGLRREKETALEIDLKQSSTPCGSRRYLVHFDVALTNKGSVRVVAKPERKPAYTEELDVLNFGASLLLRHIPKGIRPGEQVRWWGETDSKSPQKNDIEVDLLNEYEFQGKTDFWIEPGETQHGCGTIVLKSGIYLALVTFIGPLDDKEFWRRVFVIEVPGSQ